MIEAMARKSNKGSTITAEDIRLIEAAVRREEAVESGYYDGRHAPRVFVDRKKQASKNACRRWRDQ